MGQFKMPVFRKSGGILLFLLLLLSCDASAQSSDPGTEWKLLLAPYLLGNSDDGLLGGVGFGASLPDRVYTLIGAEASTLGGYRAKIKGEWGLTGSRLVGEINVGSNHLALYPSSGADPEPVATAFDKYADFFASKLYSSGQLEIGPTLWLTHSQGRNPEDPDGNSLPLESLPRLLSATSGMAGLHLRWRTANPNRPVRGWLMETRLLAGASDYAEWESPRFDLQGTFSAAHAQPLGSRLRLYLRGETLIQLETPPTLRGTIGGDETVRGEPGDRDAGRRTLSGRTELHWTVHEGFTWPMELMHWVFPFVPIWPLQLEVVPFYDIGVASDPDFGWARSRQGAGFGMRVVLPPDIVVRIDVAQSFLGGTRFYFGIGETL